MLAFPRKKEKEKGKKIKILNFMTFVPASLYLLLQSQLNIFMDNSGALSNPHQ